MAIPPAQVHRIDGELPAAEAAAACDAELSRAFALGPGEWPVFDVVLLGLGSDGHTASLFPHAAALGVVDRLAAAAEAPSAPTGRVTLTYPVLNAARAVVLLVGGADKAEAVARAFDDTVPVADCPVRGVRPHGGSLTWHWMRRGVEASGTSRSATAPATRLVMFVSSRASEALPSAPQLP